MLQEEKNNRMTTEPWPHQVDAVNFCYAKNGAMLAMEMGTGKTRCAIELCILRGHKFILILAPLSVVPVWPRQFQAHYPGIIDCLALDEGTGKQRQKRMAEFWANACKGRKSGAAVVINYDAVWREPIRSYLLGEAGKQVPLDCIILDESHRVKSPDGKASQFVGKLAQRVPFRLALTGTPMPHSPLDLYGQYRAIAPSVFGLNYHAFKNTYSVLGGFENKQVVAYKNQEQLHQKFYSCAFRVTKDVLTLPEQIHQTRYCSLGAKARRIYGELEDDLRSEIDAGEITVGNALVKLLRLQQVTSGHIVTDDGAKEIIDDGKAAALGEWMEDLPPTEPSVVFCRFRHDLETVRQQAADCKRPYFELSGMAKELDLWTRAGEQGGQVLGVQIQSGGLGVDLTLARYAAYYSLGFSLGDYEQSLSRIHRPGQKRSVFYTHFLASGTVDELVYQRLSQRKEVVEGILDFLKRKGAA